MLVIGKAIVATAVAVPESDDVGAMLVGDTKTGLEVYTLLSVVLAACAIVGDEDEEGVKPCLGIMDEVEELVCGVLGA